VGAELLFGLLTDLYERGSVLITSNLDFASWTEVFGDPRLSRPPSRILDGVPTHHHYTHGWVTFRPSRWVAFGLTFTVSKIMAIYDRTVQRWVGWYRKGGVAEV
jgi:hypothetical protein